MDDVEPNRDSEEQTYSLHNQNNETEDLKSSNKNLPMKDVKRGRKPAKKDKPPAVDNGHLLKTYLPNTSTAQNFRTHRCPNCHRCFKMNSHLKQHLKLHSPDPELQCPTCKRHFTSKSKLRVHQLREAGLKSHQCHLCPYSAVERNSLRRHLVSVHADKAEVGPELNFACPVCNERFCQSKLLKNHMKSHNVAKSSTQHFCIEEGCSFQSTLLHLIQHVTETHDFTPIECQHHACTAIFRTKTLMEEHFKNHQAYHCTDCDFACSNKRIFAQHCRQGHAGREEFSCEFCDFKTFNSVEFERHVGHFHAAEKIHKCSECEFTTAHKRGLKRHMLTHTGEKCHKCSLCEFRCRDQSYLPRHMLRHGHSKNHMCSECGYVTKWKHYLTVHMRKHSGDLRYECDQCSYRCHRMDQLNSHKLRHQEKSLMCEICAYSCKRKYELRQHMISKHSENDQPAAVYKCKFCSYSSSYRQALKNHENCKHTKSKQFQCALCSYTSFSGTSLFLHKRKTHGYVPGDKDWLQNYALKEKEKHITGNLDVFYNNAMPKQLVDVNESEIRDLNVISQEVANNDNFDSPSEEYCTLVLTTLPNIEEPTSTLQENSQNSTYVAENNNLSPKNASSITSFSSEEEGEASLDGEQDYLSKPNQIEESEEIEKRVESRSSKLNNETVVEDLKELEKIQANAMVVEGHVELLMLPMQKNSKIKFMRDRKKLNSQDRDVEFRLRRNLDSHSKNKCVLKLNCEMKMAASDAHLQMNKSINQEAVEFSSNVETQNLVCNLNLRNGSEQQLETANISANLDGLNETSQDGNSQCSRAKTADIITVDKDCRYAKINGKFECKQCRFSAIRLATIERHVATCVTKSSEQKSPKTTEKNTFEDLEGSSENSKLERHVKTASQKAFNCSVCKFVAKSMLSLNRHKDFVHKKVPSKFNCKYCSFNCKFEHRLLQHVKVKHSAKNAFQCRFCSFTTKRRYRLEEHESRHTGIGRHTCDMCDNTFGSLSKLQKHKSRLHDKNPTHFCTNCDFSSFSRDDIKRHDTRCHSGEMRFNCQQCDSKFSSQISLTKHCKRVHVRNFTCKKCQYTCGSSVELKAHQVSKHKLKKGTILKEISTTKDSKAKHACQQCQFTTKTKRLLAQHLSDEHENELDGTKSLKCSQCEFACQFQLVLEQHLRSHGGKRLYKCTHCEYSSRNKQKMTWHIRTHTGNRPYRCEECSYTCTEPSRLKQHMRVHQEERKYLCPECGYKCKWATQLKCHMTKHTGEKRFACVDCEYRSNRADALRSHRDTQHSSMRPFICEKCGKSFKTNFILKSHQQQHSDGRPFTCGLCPKSFKWPAGLRHHFLSHTKQTPFCCRLCSYRAKQRFQVVRHLKKHHPGVTVEEGVERDGEIGGLTIKEALEGAAEPK